LPALLCGTVENAGAASTAILPAPNSTQAMNIAICAGLGKPRLATNSLTFVCAVKRKASPITETF
jgi:hypothetical protein